jgi:hypothetical protein
VVAVLVTGTAGTAARERIAHPLRAAIGIDPARQERLEINDLGMFVLNDGRFAWNLDTYDGGLEYPRGSGRLVTFAAGLWAAGRVDGQVRAATAGFGTDWIPGPVGGLSQDPSRYKVYRTMRGDTTGRGEWIARAAPMGAPLTNAGEPLAVGDQTLWTVFRGGLAPSVIETQLTAYAFDRPGALRRAAFIRLRLIHKSGGLVDSAAVGLFLDPRAGADALRAASDVGRDMGYAYPAAEPASGDAVAIGMLWLGGPRLVPAGARMRPTSHVVYPNGSDPSSTLQYDRTLRGALPWGASMIDSATGLPTAYFSTGDPVAGTGWNATVPSHPHMVLGAQPFTFAPGDTQDIDVAIVIGRGLDRDAAILDLRAAADEARAAFASGFANLPAFEPYPAPGRLLAFPNPAGAGARIAFRVEAATEPVRAIVYDAAGRRVRRLLDAPFVSGRHVIEWDGADDDGRRAGAGLYFVRVTIGGREHTARVVRLAGN